MTTKRGTQHATAKVITLHGDKANAIEAAEHIINFPGGHVAVMRTSDGNYIAHIARNRHEHEGSGGGAGVILNSRVDCEDSPPSELTSNPTLYHVAVFIGVAE